MFVFYLACALRQLFEANHAHVASITTASLKHYQTQHKVLQAPACARHTRCHCTLDIQHLVEGKDSAAISGH